MQTFTFTHQILSIGGTQLINILIYKLFFNTLLWRNKPPQQQLQENKHEVEAKTGDASQEMVLMDLQLHSFTASPFLVI